MRIPVFTLLYAMKLDVTLDYMSFAILASKPPVYSRDCHNAGEPCDVDQLVVKYYCSCVNCGFNT